MTFGVYVIRQVNPCRQAMLSKPLLRQRSFQSIQYDKCLYKSQRKKCVKYSRNGEASSSYTPTTEPREVETERNNLTRVVLLTSCTFGLTMATYCCAPLHAMAAGSRRHTRRREERDRYYDDDDDDKIHAKKNKSDETVTITLPSMKTVKKKARKLKKDVTHKFEVVTRDARMQVRNMKYKMGFSDQVRLNRDGSMVTLLPRAPAAVPKAVGYAGVVLMLILLWRVVFPPVSKDNRKGRWIKDRSLGGKEIFIPDDEEYTPPSPRAAAAKWRKSSATDNRPSPLDLNMGRPTEQEVAAARAAKESTRSVTSQPLPDWWKESIPAPVYVPENQKEARQKQSQWVLKQILDKRLAGIDFTEYDLLDLRQSCQDNRAQVKIPQESIRDSLFRAAVEIAVRLASNNTNIIGGTNVRTFICGLANDIGMPQDKAMTLLRAGLAAKARGIILQVTALMRQSDDIAAMREMGSLVSLLEAFPPPPGSPEMEMVGAGMQPTMTVKERDSLMNLFNCAGGESVAYLGEECLGIPRSDS